jgi:hypothetical protein
VGSGPVRAAVIVSLTRTEVARVGLVSSGAVPVPGDRRGRKGVQRSRVRFCG